MSATEIVMEYRRKLASLTPRNRRIWELTHAMMNAMIRSENAAAQDHWKLCEKYHAESKKAEDELLELLTAESTPRCPKCGSDQMWIDNGNMVCGNSECDWETTFAQFFQPAPSPPQWISVKERLPEYGELVLMWFVTVNPANSGAVLGSRSIHEKGKYWDCGGLYRDFEYISHWQPLPVPPVASPQGERK